MGHLYVTIAEILKMAGTLKDLSNEDASDNGSAPCSMIKKNGVWRTPYLDLSGKYDEQTRAHCDCSELSYCRCGSDLSDHEDFDDDGYDPYIHDEYSEMAEKLGVNDYLDYTIMYDAEHGTDHSSEEDRDESWDGYEHPMYEEPNQDEDIQDILFPIPEPPSVWDQERKWLSQGRKWGKHSSWKKSRSTQFHPARTAPYHIL